MRKQIDTLMLISGILLMAAILYSMAIRGWYIEIAIVIAVIIVGLIINWRI